MAQNAKANENNSEQNLLKRIGAKGYPSAVVTSVIESIQHSDPEHYGTFGFKDANGNPILTMTMRWEEWELLAAAIDQFRQSSES